MAQLYYSLGLPTVHQVRHDGAARALRPLLIAARLRTIRARRGQPDLLQPKLKPNPDPDPNPNPSPNPNQDNRLSLNLTLTPIPILTLALTLTLTLTPTLTLTRTTGSPSSRFSQWS